MEDEMKISYQNGMRFDAETRGHQITVDLPPEKGGENMGMTPPELLTAAFGACIGVYVVSYLQSVKVDTTGLTVDVAYEQVKDPLRIGRLHAKVHVPAGIPEERKAAVHRVAENCLIHQTLCNEPEMEIEFT
jgi:uncharacterized OsmC-like protein